MLPARSAYRLGFKNMDKMHATGGGGEVTSSTVEQNLDRLQRAFKIVSRALLLVSISVSLLLVAPAVFIVSAVPIFPCTVQGDFSAVLLELLLLPLLICIPWTLFYFVRRTADGGSPFNGHSPRYLLLLAMAYLCLAVSNYFPSGSASITFDAFGWTFGMALGEETGFVDVGSLCACLVFLCLSFVFKYGQMLQSVSDDTV